MPNKQGFAMMDASKRREIASLGGRAAQAVGKAHKFTHEEAIAAGRKGGLRRKENLDSLAAVRAERANNPL
jgi:general stress protein YciG